jgi:predicted nuclease of predicted toxin-antitoxin system
VKLYLDENLSPRIAEILRSRRIDAVSAFTLGNVRLDDRAQFRRALGDGRVLVTTDVKDFSVIAREAVAANVEHPGIIVIPRSFRTDEFSAIAAAVAAIVKRYPRGLDGALVYARRVRR